MNSHQDSAIEILHELRKLQEILRESSDTAEYRGWSLEEVMIDNYKQPLSQLLITFEAIRKSSIFDTPLVEETTRKEIKSTLLICEEIIHENDE